MDGEMYPMDFGGGLPNGYIDGTHQMIADQRMNRKHLDHTVTPSIEMDELIIKAEPSDDTLFLNDLQMTVPKMQQPMWKAENAYDETSTDNSNKVLNFPRRKVQSERSGALPICQRCKQVFLKKQNLIRHVAQSTCDFMEYDFKCCICPMSFVSNEELQSHEHLHRTNKFFCQKYCGNYYETAQLCEEHEYTQHDYDSYVCNICSDVFPNLHILLTHMSEHNNLRRFVCPVCRLWFQLPYELHLHRVAAPHFCGKFYFKGDASQQPYANFQMQQNQSNCDMDAFADMPSPSLSFRSHQSQFSLQQNSMNRNNIIPNSHHHSAAPVGNMKLENEYFSGEYQNTFGDMSNMNPASCGELTFDRNFDQGQGQGQGQVFRDCLNASAFSGGENDIICCVPKCGVSKSNSPSLNFFKFPRNEKYLHQWLHNLKMIYNPQTNYDDFHICSLHFPKRCINRYSLCYWAVPTFNLGHDDVANLYQNREIVNTFTSGENALCSMPGCTSTRGESNLKFYNFPKDTKTLIKWCQNARLNVYSKEPRHFCSRHFEDRCIGKFRLKPWAVPTLALGTPYGKIHDNPGMIFLEEKKCCLPHCRRARSMDFNLSLYRFPREEALLRRWCYNLRLDPTVYRGKNHKICSVHFVKEALGLRKLAPGSVPTLNLGHNDTFNIYENEFYSTPQAQASISKRSPWSASSTTTSTSTSTTAKNNDATAIASASASTSRSFSPTDSNASLSAANGYDSVDVCFVPSCKKNRHIDDVTLHVIPRRAEQMKKWCHNLKIDPNGLHKGVRICSAHFEAYCIGGCMRPFAVPTLNLGHDDPDIYRNPDVIKKLNKRETCCVPHCKRNRDRDHANLHCFPSKPAMLKKWCDNLHKPMPDGSRMFNDAICEIHFEDRCLRNKRLEKWSVPTLNLGYENIVHQLPSEAEIAELWPKVPARSNAGNEEGECCVESCRRDPQVDDVKLYRTPQDDEMLAKWSHNLQCDVVRLRRARICNLHFEPQCIGKRLHSWAVPTLNLGTNMENLYENPEDREVVTRRKSNRNCEPLKMWTPRCCLPHCRKRRADDRVQLFRFPKVSRSMLAKWCHNLQQPLVGSTQRRICSDHFEPHVLTKKSPMAQAVPTLNLNPPPDFKIYQNPARLKNTKCRTQNVCSVPNCGKTRSDGVQLFRFPKNRLRLRKWCHNTRQRPAEAIRKKLRVCSIHFEEKFDGVSRCAPESIPTLHLGLDPADIYENETEPVDETKCLVQGCDAVKAMADVRLFKVPGDEVVLQKWSHNLKMPSDECRGKRICNRHFESDCIGQKVLYQWAMPTLALGHDDDTGHELIPNPKPENRYAEMKFRCCVPSCGRSRKFDDAQINSFPKSRQLFDRWKYNLRLDLHYKDREKLKICNEHFEEICLGNGRLKLGSIPTINLGHNDIGDLYKVNPDELQTVRLCGKRRALSRAKCETLPEETIDNDDETLGEVDSHEIKSKCVFPGCTTPNEIFELPTKNKRFTSIWREKMKIDVKESPTIMTICALHLMDVYEEVSPAINELLSAIDADETLLEAVDKIKNAYERFRDSAATRSSRCSVRGCKARCDTGLYDFPSDENVFSKWAENLKIDMTTPHRMDKICGQHFEVECFAGSSELHSWAVPTRKLGHNETPPHRPVQPSEGGGGEASVSHVKMKISLDGIKCCVASCGKSRLRHGIRLFSFPSSPKILRKWCHNLRLPAAIIKRKPRICNEHFQKRCIDGKSLKAWAIPTRLLGHTDAIYFNPRRCPPRVKKIEDTQIRCCMTHCKNNNDTNGGNEIPITFDFPVDNRELLAKWSENLRMDVNVIENRKLCIEHFEDGVLDADGCRLKPNALPTVNLGHDGPPIYENRELLQPNRSQTIEDVADDDDYDTVIVDSSALKKEKRISNVAPICCLKHCRKEKTRFCHLATFGFPKDDELRQKWCDNLKLRMDECFGRVCIEHFEPDAVGKRKLKPGAVPTVNLGHTEPIKHSYGQSQSGETTAKVSSNNGEMSQSVFRLSCLKHLRKKRIKQKYKRFWHTKQSASAKLPDHTELPPDHMVKGDLDLEAMNVQSSRNCRICNCHRGTPNTTLYKFPTDNDQLRKWMHNTNIVVDVSCRWMYRICNRHFEAECFNARKRLVAGTMPTLNLGPFQPDSIFKNEFKTIGTRIFESDDDDNDELLFDRNALGEDDNGDENEKKSDCTMAVAVAVTTATVSNSLKVKKTISISSRRCCVEECGSRPEYDDVILHKFPVKMDVFCKWEHNTKTKVDRGCKWKFRICNRHFEPQCYNSNNRLLSGAIPTLNLGPHPPAYVYGNVYEDLNYGRNHRRATETHPREEQETEIVLLSDDEDDAEGNEYKEIVNTRESRESSKEGDAQSCCCIEGCKKSSHDGVILYKFPIQRDMLKKWQHNAQIKTDPQREVSAGFRICNRHFETKCFNADNRLKATAVPTLNLGPEIPKLIYNNLFLTDKGFSRPNRVGHLGVFNLKMNKIRHNRNVESVGRPFRLNASRYCRIEGCTSRASQKGVILHKYPIPLETLKKWMHNTQTHVQRECEWRFRLCNRHFEPFCYNSGNRLLPGAIPTLNLGPRKPALIYQNQWRLESELESQKEHSIVNHDDDEGDDYDDDDEGEGNDDNEIDDDLTPLFLGELLDEKTPQVHQSSQGENDLLADDFAESTVWSGEHGDGVVNSNSSRRCRIAVCNSHAKQDGVILHKFPIYEDHFLKWVHNTQLQVDKSCRWKFRICNRHFESGCFNSRHRLVHGSMPTLNLGATQPAVIYHNEFTQNDFDMKSSDDKTTTTDSRDIDDFSPYLSNDQPPSSNPAPSSRVGGERNVPHCAIATCGHIFRDDDDVHLHRLPRDSEIQRKWMFNCRLASVTTNVRVCSKHFEKKCFIGVRRQLKIGALPTLNLGHNNKIFHI